MSNPIGTGILAALAMTSMALAGDDEKTKTAGGNPPQTMPQDGIHVTAAPGKGITFSTDGFRLNLINRIQVNFGFANLENGEDTLGVRIRRARTKLQGDAYKDTVHFVMQFEWADGQTSDITDALMLWDFYRTDSMEMSLRFGQGKTLFGTEATGTSSSLEFVDRALPTRTFANIRTRQAQVVGKMGNGMFRWHGGLLNGDVAQAAIGGGEDNNNASNEMHFVAGASYGTGHDEIYGEGRKQGALKPTEETMWIANAGIHYGQNDAQDIGGVEYDAFTLNGGGAMWRGHIHVLAEAFYRDDSADRNAAVESEAAGWQAQVSFTADKGPSVQWAYGVRLSGVHVLDSAGSGTVIFNPGIVAAPTGTAPPGFFEGDIFEIQAMASAYYAGHSLKTQFGYTFQSIDPDAGGAVSSDNHIIELQSQIVF